MEARMVAKDFETEYLRREIEGKSNIEIVVMMYDAGIKFMNRAIQYINEKNVQQSHYNITKAQNIVTELTNMLDMEGGGEISQNLYNLYGFISDRLINGNIRKDTNMIEEALEIFSNLREPWAELARKHKNGTLEDEPKEKKPQKQTETTKDSKEKETDDKPQPKPGARNVFKNVSNEKEKPYKPFSIKG